MLIPPTPAGHLPAGWNDLRDPTHPGLGMLHLAKMNRHIVTMNFMESSVLAPDDQFKHVIIMQYHVIVASLLGAQCLSGVRTMSYKQQDAYKHYSLWVVELITTR